jgi:hypothetical protein
MHVDFRRAEFMLGPAALVQRPNRKDQRPLLGSESQQPDGRSGSAAALREDDLDAAELPIELACPPADDRVRHVRPVAVVDERQPQSFPSDPADWAESALTAASWPGTLANETHDLRGHFPADRIDSSVGKPLQIAAKVGG